MTARPTRGARTRGRDARGPAEDPGSQDAGGRGTGSRRPDTGGGPTRGPRQDTRGDGTRSRDQVTRARGTGNRATSSSGQDTRRGGDTGSRRPDTGGGPARGRDQDTRGDGTGSRRRDTGGGPARGRGTGSRGWLDGARSELAAERILDAAGRLFVEKGVTATGMADVARAAGCSRATLYRYFETRDELRTAYVHRAARRIGAEVIGHLDSGAGPRAALVDAVLDALARVRRDPTLVVWFTPGDSSLASSIARSSAVIETMVAAFLGDAAGAATTARARWLVRVIVSLLAQPGTGEDDERAMLEHFVAPVVVPAPTDPRVADLPAPDDPPDDGDPPGRPRPSAGSGRPAS